MITEKSHTAQYLIDKITPTATKVSFMPDDVLSKALLHLENKGLPGIKHEEYKYCPVEAVIKREFKTIEQRFGALEKVDEYLIPDTCVMLVLNGEFMPALSTQTLPTGVTAKNFSQLADEEKNTMAALADVQSDAFVALNTAFSGDGLYLKINIGVVLNKPIHVLYVNTPNAECFVNPRNVMWIAENASATIIEEHVTIGSAKVFSNALSEKYLSANAHVKSYILQNDSSNAYTVNTNHIQLQRDANYDNTTITMGGQLVRNNHHVVLAGENAQAHLYGLFTANGNRIVDNHTLMDHQVPHCESNELYKGLMNDKGTGVFNGKIFVRKDAQKTNAYQSSKNILLSDDAVINAKPQLEIYANDVKCSHGTSTGKIDENALFYLNARGIGKESAKKMLLASFAGEIINRIHLPFLQERIAKHFADQC
jgi:Fe-S cluster assembly protein SufD